MIMPCGGIGAPLVSLEKIEAGDEGERLRDLMQRQTGRTVAALMAGEIGGGNGLVPVTWAARMGLPVVDADGMGRAFPLASQVTMELAGISPCPAAMTDERGNVVVFRTISGEWAERLERAAAAEFGGMGSSADFSMTAAQAREATVRGSVVIEDLEEDAGRLIRLELQNEHLVALERGRLLASVPDLITVLDRETADAISADRIRYAQRVVVIAFGCAAVWRTERGIAATGPRAFGYDFDFVPVEELAEAPGQLHSGVHNPRDVANGY